MSIFPTYTSVANDKNKTPFEAIFGRKPDLSHVKKVDSKSYVHIPKARSCGKFNHRAEIGYLVGYHSGNSYRIYLPSKHRVVVSRDVKFHELFGSNAVDNGNKVDLLELEGTEHEVDMMLNSPDLPGDEPANPPPAVENASSAESNEDVVDGAQQSNEQNLNIEPCHTIQRSEDPTEHVMHQIGLNPHF